MMIEKSLIGQISFNENWLCENWKSSNPETDPLSDWCSPISGAASPPFFDLKSKGMDWAERTESRFVFSECEVDLRYLDFISKELWDSKIDELLVVMWWKERVKSPGFLAWMRRSENISFEEHLFLDPICLLFLLRIISENRMKFGRTTMSWKEPIDDLWETEGGGLSARLSLLGPRTGERTEFIFWEDLIKVRGKLMGRRQVFQELLQRQRTQVFVEH